MQQPIFHSPSGAAGEYARLALRARARTGYDEVVHRDVVALRAELELVK